MDQPSSNTQNPDPEALRQVLESLAEYSISRQRIKFRGIDLGEGGFGTVRLAYLRSGSFKLIRLFERPTTVAVKELHAPAGTEIPMRIAYRLAREMRVWASFNHPNLLEFTGFHLSEDNQTAYLVSPYMKNGNVNDYLGRKAPSPEYRLGLVIDTIKGLNYLHQRDPPVVHGDLKALNVLINDNGRALLSDFGLAIAKQDGPTGLSTSKGFRGSFRYSSPEALDLGQVECPSDIWSWGCLAQEIMTDKGPYSEYQNEAKVIALICEPEGRRSPEHPDTSAVPPPLLQLIRKCWSIEVEKRPISTICLNEMQSSYPGMAFPPKSMAHRANRSPQAATEDVTLQPVSQSTATLPAATTTESRALGNTARESSSSLPQTASTQRRSRPGISLARLVPCLD